MTRCTGGEARPTTSGSLDEERPTIPDGHFMEQRTCVARRDERSGQAASSSSWRFTGFLILDRRVERSRRDMEALIRDPVALNVVLQIHGLNAEAEPFRRLVAGLGRNVVSLAKYVTPVIFKVELPVSSNVALR
jgi:hypothetical protein